MHSTRQSQKNVLLALGRYNPKTHKGVARFAGQHGWHLNAEMAYFGQIPRSWRGDGIITLMDHKPELIDFIKAASVPIVDLSVIRLDIPLPRVSGDHYRIGCLGAEHFLQHAFRHFAWFSTSEDAVTDLRWQGFSETLAKSKFTAQRWSFQQPKRTKLDDWAAKCNFLQEQLKSIPKPVAVLTFRDADAGNVLDACAKAGLSVPEEVAILGTDNDELICESARVPLSSINHDLEGLGYAGASLLHKLMKGQSPPASPKLIVPKGITVRQSTEVLAVNDAPTRRALQFILTNCSHRIGAEEVAQASGISRRKLEEAFRTNLNHSVSDHLATQRLIRARDLLNHSDLTVSDIAALSGFNTPQYFNLVFRREFGITPRHFRLKSARP